MVVTAPVVSPGESSPEWDHIHGIWGVQKSPVLLGGGTLSGRKRKFRNCQLPLRQVWMTVFPQRFYCGCPWSLKSQCKLHSAHFRVWKRRSSNTTCDKTAAWILDHSLFVVNCHSMEIKRSISPTCSRFSKLHELRSFNDWNIFTWILRRKRTVFSEHWSWEFFSVWAAGFSTLPMYLISF